MKFPPLTPTYPYLPPTLQKPITSPPTPTLYRGVGVGVGEVGTPPTFPPPCDVHDLDFRAQIGGSAMLTTIRPGLVLHLWQGRKEVAAVPLTPSATITLCRDLSAALPGVMPR